MHNIKAYLNKNITLFVSVVFVVLFLISNITTVAFNRRFIEEANTMQNEAFVEMIEHLLAEGDQASVLLFIEHYGHTHNVYLTYASVDGSYYHETVVHPSQNAERYHVMRGSVHEATLYIDNIDSDLVAINTTYLIWLNVILIGVYALTLLMLAKRLNTHNRLIVEDIVAIEETIKNYERNSRFNFDDLFMIDKALKNAMHTLKEARARHTKNIQSLAHDIKTPLTVIKATLEMRAKNEGNAQEEIYSMLEEVEAINALVEALIKGQTAFTVAPLKLPDALNETLDKFKPLFAQKDINLTLDAQASLEVNAPKQALERILEHAMQNALKAMETGAVSVILTHDSLTIKDTGPGINQTVLEALKNQTLIPSHSTGLGLKIMQEMADSYFYGMKVKTSSNGTSIIIFLHS